MGCWTEAAHSSTGRATEKVNPMALRFTSDAFNDLDHLELYLGDRSPQGLRNVLTALQKTFRRISDNPSLGRPTIRTGVHVAVETKYQYLIPYYDDGSDIWILRVYHPRRLPLDDLSQPTRHK